MTLIQLREAVRTLRLERGWTYDELAADIRRVNGNESVAVSVSTVRRFILAEHPPRETHEYAIRLYLSRVAPAHTEPSHPPVKAGPVGAGA